jgi:hypothetical protein
MIKARLIHENGRMAWLRVYWNSVKIIGKCEKGCCDRTESLNDCPNCYGSGKPGCHNAQIKLGESDDLEKHDQWGKPEDYPDDRWPTKCDHCPAIIPAGGPYKGETRKPELVQVHRQVFTQRRYSTPSGSPEPGDVFWAKWHHWKGDDGKEQCIWWDNCDGKHLIAILPNGTQWDIMSRASNCALKDDKVHRCWILHGSPEAGNLHVDKNGLTCAAGAGSIAVEGYHGFLQNGHFT